jgi:thioredoxin-like negative regulator of GroEL
MQGLLFLTAQDFYTAADKTGNLLCINMDGLSLVMFYSTKCDHCHTLMPVYKQLPNTVSGCKICMINVSNNKQVVSMSKDTLAPLTYVPFIILYVNGKPFMRYDGPHDLGELQRFIVEVSKKVSSQQFMKQEEEEDEEEKPEENIPAYSVGRPYGAKKVCYLNYDSAYDKDD